LICEPSGPASQNRGTGSTSQTPFLAIHVQDLYNHGQIESAAPELSLEPTGLNSFPIRVARGVLRAAACGLALIATCSLHAADAKPADEPAELRWGGDQEGGAPYIFTQRGDRDKVVGFEVDLADALARRLGTRAVFVQTHWENMLLALTRKNIDVALNGYEYSDERAARYLPSLPYYIYELGLCANHEKRLVTSWESLAQPLEGGAQRRVGVLAGSAGDRYITEQYGKSCQVLRYQGSAEALELVNTGQIDATVQDLPALHYFVEHLKRYPDLAVIDRPAAKGYYVIYVRPDDERLIAKINQALRSLHETGELQEIYEHYGIWNGTQQELSSIWEKWDSELRESKQNKWFELAEQFPRLVKAAGVTVALTVVSMPLAVLIGMTVALVRSWGTPALGGRGSAEALVGRMARMPFTVYVEIVRGTPLAFQLFVVYFILPEFGLRINEFWSGVLALAVNYSAYEAEIFRLGLQAVPRGQMEAAVSLGMPRMLAVRRIILPQAVRMVIPATANDFIALFKDTAVCSVIAVEELSTQYSLGAKDTGLFLEMAALTSILYLMMSYPLSLLAGWLERRLRSDII
jgi:polar amino acid transport system substrate-binding protein